MEHHVKKGLSFKDSQIKILTDQNTSLLGSVQAIENKLLNVQEEKKCIECHVEEVKVSLEKEASRGKYLQEKNSNLVEQLKETENKFLLIERQNKEILQVSREQERSCIDALDKLKSVVREKDELKNKVSLLEQKDAENMNLINVMKQEKLEKLTESRHTVQKCGSLEKENFRLRKKLDVEVDSLSEQLTLRKQKQYSLLETINNLEEENRKYEYLNKNLESQLEAISSKFLALRDKLSCYEKVEAKKDIELHQVAAVKNKLDTEISRLEKELTKRQNKINLVEDKNATYLQDIRKLSEKVFDCLERIKVYKNSELKLKEIIKRKDTEVIALSKKIGRMGKAINEKDKNLILKTNNLSELEKELKLSNVSQRALNHRLNKELNEKLKALEENSSLHDENKSLLNRVEYLLSKLKNCKEAQAIDSQRIEEFRSKVKEHEGYVEKQEKQILKLKTSRELLIEALQAKQYESEKFQTQIRILRNRKQPEKPSAVSNETDSTTYVHYGNCTGNFEILENFDNIKGLSMIVASGNTSIKKKKIANELLKELNLKKFMAMFHSHPTPKLLVLKKLCEILDVALGPKIVCKSLTKKISLLEEEKSVHTRSESANLKHAAALEESKRMVILRYIASKLNEVKSNSNRGVSGVINLRSCGIGEEECHAICAVLKNYQPIQRVNGDLSHRSLQLNLSNNNIDDEALKAFAPLFSDLKTMGDLKVNYLDLQENRISNGGINYLCSLVNGGRQSLIRHTHVHSHGRIECLGTKIDSVNKVDVEAILIIDCRKCKLIQRSDRTFVNMEMTNLEKKTNINRILKKGPKKQLEFRKLELNHETTRQQRQPVLK